jgi:hypothetical protein
MAGTDTPVPGSATATTPHQTAVIVDAATGLPGGTDALAQAFTYNAEGFVSTITAGPNESNNYWMQTFGYTAGKLTSISKWVLQ